MNKYFRTKDNKIYKVDSIAYIEGDTPYYCVESVDDFSFEQIINVADTIEELCDGFMIFSDYDKLVPLAVEENLGTLLKCYYEKDYIIYGFIKTSKGLIYVAKMNDKGDLELIWP